MQPFANVLSVLASSLLAFISVVTANLAREYVLTSCSPQELSDAEVNRLEFWAMTQDPRYDSKLAEKTDVSPMSSSSSLSATSALSAHAFFCLLSVAFFCGLRMNIHDAACVRSQAP